MEIRSIKWQDTLIIRHKVLWPDKPMSFCHVDGDAQAQHFGVFLDERLVCVASIYKDNREARLRKFATLACYQGQGIGTKLIKHIIEQLKSDGIKRFWCDARVSAQGFYEALGLEKYNDEFNKSGIAYCKMQIRF